MDKEKFMQEMDVQYKIATELIEEYHAGQVDMGGEPYINHLRAVFDKVWEMQHADKHWGYNDEDVMYAKAGITALLHDILEDTECTEEILKE
jgi:(p)ppGpp synthase/HD superfamily hydrolase